MAGRDSAMLLQAIMGRGRAPDNDYGEAMARQAEEATQRQVLGDAADAWKTAVGQRGARQTLEYSLTGGREDRSRLMQQAQAEAAAKAAALAQKMKADQDKLAQDWKISQGDFDTRKEVANITAKGREAEARARPLPRSANSSGSNDALKRAAEAAKNMRTAMQNHARLMQQFGKTRETDISARESGRFINAFIGEARAAGYSDEHIKAIISEAAPGAGQDDADKQPPPNVVGPSP